MRVYAFICVAFTTSFLSFVYCSVPSSSSSVVLVLLFSFFFVPYIITRSLAFTLSDRSPPVFTSHSPFSFTLSVVLFFRLPPVLPHPHGKLSRGRVRVRGIQRYEEEGLKGLGGRRVAERQSYTDAVNVIGQSTQNQCKIRERKTYWWDGSSCDRKSRYHLRQVFRENQACCKNFL